MNQKISSLLSPKNGLYFLCLLVFAGLTALLKAYYLAAGEAALTLLLFLYSRHREARRRKGAQRWLERLADNVDQAARDTTLNCPIPVAVFQPDTDEMVWTNDKFLTMTGAPEHRQIHRHPHPRLTLETLKSLPSMEMPLTHKHF